MLSSLVLLVTLLHPFDKGAAVSPTELVRAQLLLWRSVQIASATYGVLWGFVWGFVNKRWQGLMLMLAVGLRVPSSGGQG
jgi:hypothetical protein